MDREQELVGAFSAPETDKIVQIPLGGDVEDALNDPDAQTDVDLLQSQTTLGAG